MLKEEASQSPILWVLLAKTMQQTLAKPVIISGRGLHTGKVVTMKVLPEEAYYGRRFIRTDLENQPEVRVFWQNRLELPLCTALNVGKDKILTVEHFLAACQGLGLDNIKIELDGPELPALDGSALEFYKKLILGGQVKQEAKPVFKLKETITINDGQAFIVAVPANQLRLSYTFVSEGMPIPDMFFDYLDKKDDFLTELAPARTIAFKERLNDLRSKGLALGGDESMVVLIDSNGFANERRFEDEVARHKLLDLYGDLALIGEYRLLAHIIAVKTGHRHNALLAQKIAEQMKMSNKKNRKGY